MRLEHVAILVDDPNAVADWYCKNLDMKLVRQGPEPVLMTFVSDHDGNIMFEFYKHADVPTPDYGSMNPLILHIAFYSDDVEATRKKLLAAGATAEGEITVTPAGDTLAMHRDPFGLALQVLCRKVKML